VKLAYRGQIFMACAVAFALTACSNLSATPVSSVTFVPQVTLVTQTPRATTRTSAPRETRGATGPNMTRTPRAATLPSATPSPSAIPQKVETAATSTPTFACNQTSGVRIAENMNSKIISAEPVIVHVYLPPCYSLTQTRYPVLYLLPGLGVTDQWADINIDDVANTLISQKKIAPMIIIAPESDEDLGEASKFVYTGGGSESWEDMIANELVHFVDTRYRTLQDSTQRGIGGISRGGYWSLEIGLQHPDVFRNVGGHSPAISADLLYGASESFTMMELARSVDDARTQRFYLDSGDEDAMQYAVEALGKQMTSDRISNTVSISSGGHDEAYWRSRLPDYLTFYAAEWRVAK